MADSYVDKRQTRPSVRLDLEEVRRERAISLKRSRSGHLSTLTVAQREIGTLLKTTSKVTLVKGKFDQYETLWSNFADSHNKFMEVADADEKARNSEQFSALVQQRINLSTIVEEFICSTTTELNEQVMQDLQKTTRPTLGKYTGSRSSRSSRYSKISSSSRALDAEKAQLALEIAKQEKQWKIKAKNVRIREKKARIRQDPRNQGRETEGRHEVGISEN